MDKTKLDKFKNLIDNADKIVIIQADNPDGDSLGSSIALEQILTNLGKDAYMYCSVDVPTYLRYIPAWSRVQKELPHDFDLGIIVDTSTMTLLENMDSMKMAQIKSKPSIMLDHHVSDATIDFTSLYINEGTVSTGELIFDIAKHLGYEMNMEAKEAIMTTILSDSLGLTTPNVKSSAIRVVAELVDMGVSISTLEDKRRETYRKSLDLIHYKGRLLERIETYLDNQLAMVTITYDEIIKFSPLYNPPMLIMEDMRLIEGNKIIVALKTYNDGRILGKVRSQNGCPIAEKLASSFGGGGHDYSSGFKTYDYKDVNDLKREIISKTNELLEEERKKNEIIQYPN